LDGKPSTAGTLAGIEIMFFLAMNAIFQILRLFNLL